MALSQIGNNILYSAQYPSTEVRLYITYWWIISYLKDNLSMKNEINNEKYIYVFTNMQQNCGELLTRQASQTLKCYLQKEVCSFQ